MSRHLVLFATLVLTALAGYAAGQTSTKPLPEGFVISGDDLGFRIDEPYVAVMKPERGSVTGTFVVRVNGRWLEVRPGFKAVPAK
jgi:hypothetical protein